MIYFTIVTFLAYIVELIFFVLALASGLYYIAELIEEYTSLAAKILRSIIWVTILLYLGFYFFENLPIKLLICGTASQIFYLRLLKGFPVFHVYSLSFILSCVLLIINHYLTLSYFAVQLTPFSQVMAFFVLCVWIVPFSLFISLTANDNVLPTTSISGQNLVDSKFKIVNFPSKKMVFEIFSLILR
uniref:Protein TEX261 n=1 Tax=Romanomermis culicivorax TaxID=13658 RepID=A0A915K098_ROMCU